LSRRRVEGEDGDTKLPLTASRKQGGTESRRRRLKIATNKRLCLGENGIGGKLRIGLEKTNGNKSRISDRTSLGDWESSPDGEQ